MPAKTRDLPMAPPRRCQSLSPSTGRLQRTCFEHGANVRVPNQMLRPDFEHMSCTDRDCSIPQCVVIKMLRSLATKKRDFMKLRKGVIAQQNNLLEQYAALKELENKVGNPVDETLGEVRILSVTSWPAHDLLLLVREDLRMPMDSEIGGIFGPQVLQQLHAQLTPIPEEVLGISAEIMARRIDLLNLLRGKNARERPSYHANLEWKAKNTELDHETERLHRLVAGSVENIKAKISYSLELAKIPWLDRDTIVKKSERLQKDNTTLAHKIEELKKDEGCDTKDSNYSTESMSPIKQALEDELNKERAAREALKEVVSAAESMLRLARARIATVEKQLKDTKTELETARRKHKELEHLYRHRETSYDARSRKLIESSRTGEMVIETLSQQRDSLEIRVKELREQMEVAEQLAESREAELLSKVESLQAKILDQEKKKEAAEAKAMESEDHVKYLEEKFEDLREHSNRLVEMERKRCLDCIPLKENEPSDRETEIWKELQSTRLALLRTEEQLRLARADKDSFLDSLSKIAADGVENIQQKMSAALLQKEQKISKLQQMIETHKENEKIMEQSMTQYENQMASLRLEIKRLRNYDCYVKDISCQELQTELLDLSMQMETLRCERSALVTAAATRSLMLERHERAASLFARVTRARHDVAAILNGRTEPPPPLDEASRAEASRSLSSLCATAADTWSALRAERARTQLLERAVLSQSLQLEREGRVRTQLERRRALLEREVLRSHAMSVSPEQPQQASLSRSPSLIQDLFCYR